MNTFSKNLSYLIEISGKRQSQIAKDLGISKQKLSNWKLSVVEPCIDELIRICNYFDITADELIGRV